MKTATELNAIAMDVMQKSLEKAIEMAHNELLAVAPILETAATSGALWYTHKLSGGADKATFIAELERYGYKVHSSGYSVQISWC